MAVFLFRCPNTGFRVQGWVEDDEAQDSGEAYEGVICHACGRLHLVNPRTGETAGSADRALGNGRAVITDRGG